MALLNEQPLPSFDRPIHASGGVLTSNDERKLTQLHCKEEIIKWLISVLLIDSNAPASHSANPSILSSAQTNINTNLSVSTSHISNNEQYTSASTSTIATLIPTFDAASSSMSFRDRTGDLETL